MRMIIVDDDNISMKLFKAYCQKVSDIEIIGTFLDPAQALSFAKNHTIDIAALDIYMPELNGIELGWALKEFNPKIVLMFITTSEEYAMEAFRLKAVSYITKPFQPDVVIEALNRCKLLCQPPHKHVFIRTFGSFDVFVDGKAMHFSRQKSKELLAYLVDRHGGTATMEQIISALWEDHPYNSSVRNSYHVALKDLRKNLSEAGIPEILCGSRNQKAVNINCFDCDLYRFLASDLDAIDAFRGEYMDAYSWAESTTGFCTEKKQKMSNKI